MNLFIDTNVFLSFFHFSNDDLEELRKLAVTVRNGKITLLLPDQVESEFRRNRDGKVADALKKLREQKLNFQLPQFSKDYAEYNALRKALRDTESARSQLLLKIEADVARNALKADTVILELFRDAQRVTETADHFGRGRDRVARGNPPGKKGSLGDSINWEALLDCVKDGSDLYLVSGDADWTSPLDEDQFDSFLMNEWSTKKRSKLFFFRQLSGFLHRHFPDINLLTEEEKDRLIQALATSGSFAKSRTILQQLASHTDFTVAQLNGIAKAATTNNQVYWIASDPDITKYLRSLLAANSADLEPGMVAELEKRLEGTLAI